MAAGKRVSVSLAGASSAKERRLRVRSVRKNIVKFPIVPDSRESCCNFPESLARFVRLYTCTGRPTIYLWWYSPHSIWWYFRQSTKLLSWPFCRINEPSSIALSRYLHCRNVTRRGMVPFRLLALPFQRFHRSHRFHRYAGFLSTFITRGAL
jgi:hypothetical protein